MSVEAPIKLSPDRLEELSKNFDYDKDVVPNYFEEVVPGFMSLKLGEGDETMPGYRKLIFEKQHDSVFILAAKEPDPDDPGYQRSRPLTLNEIVTFVQVARHVCPDKQMTTDLIRVAEETLTDQQSESPNEVDAIDQALNIISPH